MTKSGFGADFDAQKLDLPVEVAALDLQIIRCFGDVPRALAKLAADVFTLKGRPGFPGMRNRRPMEPAASAGPHPVAPEAPRPMPESPIPAT